MQQGSCPGNQPRLQREARFSHMTSTPCPLPRPPRLQSGAAIRFLTPARAVGKLLAAPLHMGRYFDSDGGCEGAGAGAAKRPSAESGRRQAASGPAVIKTTCLQHTMPHV